MSAVGARHEAARVHQDTRRCRDGYDQRFLGFDYGD
jgi:hypothetical protein